MSAPEEPWFTSDAIDRRDALAAAVALTDEDGCEHHHGRCPRDIVLGAADEYYRWLRRRETLRAVTISLTPGPITTEGTPAMTTSMNLQDDQMVSFTLTGQDAKGVQVPPPDDTWNWTTDDPDGAVASLSVAADGGSATLSAVAPGTVTVSVSGTNSGIQGAEAIIVTAGPAVSVSLVSGTPADEQPAAPSA